jgi:hypothetical protein
MTTSYDLTQTTFLFSWASNYTSSVKASTAQDFAAFEKLALTTGGPWTPSGGAEIQVNGFLSSIGSRLIGADWRIDWGPGVYLEPGAKAATNTAFVAYSPSQDTYICAIAGTNLNSMFDWLDEDLSVGAHAMVNFPVDISKEPVGDEASKDVAQVSLGTARGIYYLLTQLVDSSGATLNLKSYLSNLIPKAGSKTSRVIFTGHSLGGALSPSLGLQMYPSMEKWTKKGGQVCILPTAGPTPGNEKFAGLWSEKDAPFRTPVAVKVNPGNQVTTLNQSYWNTFDVVPHAWTKLFAQLGKDYYFYGYNGATPHTIQCSVCKLENQPPQKLADEMSVIGSAAQLKGKAGKMGDLPNRVGIDVSWPITYPTVSSYSTLEQPSVLKDRKTFEQVAGLVHTWQYFNMFKIIVKDVPRAVSNSTAVTVETPELALA